MDDEPGTAFTEWCRSSALHFWLNKESSVPKALVNLDVGLRRETWKVGWDISIAVASNEKHQDRVNRESSKIPADIRQ